MTTFDWVVRDVLPTEPLTISQAGQQQVVSRSVVLDPAWKRENLTMVVFVQGDHTRPGGSREVIQAASLEFGMP